LVFFGLGVSEGLFLPKNLHFARLKAFCQTKRQAIEYCSIILMPLKSAFQITRTKITNLCASIIYSKQKRIQTQTGLQ